MVTEKYLLLNATHSNCCSLLSKSLPSRHWFLSSDYWMYMNLSDVLDISREGSSFLVTWITFIRGLFFGFELRLLWCHWSSNQEIQIAFCFVYVKPVELMSIWVVFGDEGGVVLLHSGKNHQPGLSRQSDPRFPFWGDTVRRRNWCWLNVGQVYTKTMLCEEIRFKRKQTWGIVFSHC